MQPFQTTTPLVEAVCEFRYATTTEWDWTIPGRLYDRLAPEFPERETMMGTNFEVPPGPETRTVVVPIPSGPSMIRMLRKDGTALVQVAPGLLSINHLNLGYSWTTFRELVDKVRHEYDDVARGIAPTRLGLRYINRVRLDFPTDGMGSVLSTMPPLAGALGRPLAAAYQRFGFRHDDPVGILVLQTGLSLDGSEHAVILDLDFTSTGAESASIHPNYGPWLDKAHERIKDSLRSALSRQYWPDKLAVGSST